ncbi:MAG: ribokinase [Lachnospiraceae bacterium]|nr:ribokinase [Lachnospiraceae bacterium]MDY5741643.1 ribokinase [Lachnospiraceae bacterium]
MRKILNFGSLNYDYVYRVDHILQGGETLAACDLQEFCGGKGLNQSVAMVRAGLSVFHAGSLGEEGERLATFLKKEGVDIRYCRCLPGKSGHTIIQVDKDGQNSILVFGGANRCQDRGFIDQVLQNFDADDILVLQNEINELSYILEAAANMGMNIVFNPSPVNDEITRMSLSAVRYFIINEIEGYMLSGESDPLKILAKMKQLYPRATVVLTMGALGVYAVSSDSEKVFYQEAFPVVAVDTTAAGDTFLGYFLAGLCQQKAIPDCLKLAAKAAAITVTRPGAAPSIPRRSELSAAE